MAKSDLLKQAIADAKAVKETALANAKIALQEAFAPRIESMLQAQLQNEIEGDDEDLAGAEVADDANLGAEGGEATDDFTWTDDSLAANVGGEDYNFQVTMAGDEEEPAGEEVAPEEVPAASEDDMSAEYNEGNDLNLDEILRELEGDLEEADDYGVEAGLEEYAKLKSSNIGTKGAKKLTEEDEIAEGDDYGSDDANIDEIIEAILREEEEAMAQDVPAAQPTEEPAEVVEAMQDELDLKEEELQEAYNTVNQLRKVINEVNLLNAKLLYTNKLFRNFELSEAQKMKVIENFDRAGNTREAKLVFATLAESFAKPVTKKRVVKESYASKATQTTAPSAETTQVLSEGFELANRWKKLAGLL